MHRYNSVLIHESFAVLRPLDIPPICCHFLFIALQFFLHLRAFTPYLYL